MNAWVKDWKDPMICSTRLKKMMGLSIGRVIFQNCCSVVAPSTLAAS